MADSFEGLDASFVAKLERLNEVCPFSLTSGRRTNAEQTQLYNDWKAGRHKVPVVARPGTSRHESGTAADISGDYACFRTHAPALGLHFPVAGEPWHVEPVGAAGPENAEATTGPLADPVSSAEALFMDTVLSGEGDPMQQPQDVLGAAGATMAAGAPMAVQGGDWQASLSPAERWILEKESGLNPAADNPTSTAFGIWQGLEATRKQYLGADWETTDPVKQLDAFRRYVADRYGTAEAAQAHWQANGWY